MAASPWGTGMKLYGQSDIDAAATDVFAVLTDFVHFEKVALRQGADVERTDRLRGYSVGSTWNVHFRYRGKGRHLAAELTALEPPSALNFEGKSGGFEFSVSMSLLPLAPRLTRLSVVLDVRPRTLAARIILQTAKLGRVRFEQRFSSRTEAFGRYLQRRLR